MRRYFLGIDWSDQSYAVYVMDETGDQIEELEVVNSAEGLSEFSGLLNAWMASGIALCAAIEKPEGRIIDFLLDHGVSVYPINPKAHDRSRDGYRLSGATSDAFDAYVLADMLRKDQHRRRALQPNSEAAAELKMLTRDYHKLVREQTRLINQLKATLKEYYPRPLEVFEDLATKTALDFLQAYPTPQAAEKLSFARWHKFAKAHRMSSDEIENLWEILHRPQVPAPAHVVRAKSRLVDVQIQQLRVAVEGVKAYRREVQDFFAALPVAELTRSLPGGKSGIIIPTLFAELGDAAGRWESFRHLQAEAGTTPYTRQSGKTKGVYFRFSCNKMMRYATYWLTMISLSQCEWAKAYYDSQKARGIPHNQALRALGSKWLKIIFVIWRDRVPYDEDRHLANIARQHLRQAVLT